MERTTCWLESTNFVLPGIRCLCIIYKKEHNSTIHKGQQLFCEDLNQTVSDTGDKKVASEDGMNLSIINLSFESLKKKLFQVGANLLTDDEGIRA